MADQDADRAPALDPRIGAAVVDVFVLEAVSTAASVS